MMDALMALFWFKRPQPRAAKSVAELRADARIRDKEVELTYLRQVVNIAKETSEEATNGLHAALEKVAPTGGEKFDQDFDVRRRKE